MAAGRKTTLKEVGETLAFIVERMATREDLKQFATKDDVTRIVTAIVEEKLLPISEEQRGIRKDLKQINERLDVLAENYKNLNGVTKEIDEIRAEVRAIQKHLGIERRIAA